MKRNGDHFGVGIISGSIWGSFEGWGSFRGRDHFGGCTVLPITAYAPMRKALPERVTFSRLRVYERIGLTDESKA